MIFSEEEILAILKKELPEVNGKNLEDVAGSIIRSGKHWQEVDLDEHVHDDVKMQVLHDLCKPTNNNEPPKDVRLFFKK